MLLKYNSNIWNPTQVYSIDLIESVQQAFTKRVKAISKLSYTERLGIFNLEPLELRRLRYDLIQYYKILNNLTPLNPAVYFKLHYPLTSARDPSPIIVKPIHYSNEVVSFIDMLIAGTVCHRLFAMLNRCWPLNQLYVTLIYLIF